MGLFRKKDEEFILFPDEEKQFGTKSHDHPSPIALTPEEVLGINEEIVTAENATSALESLKKRIAETVKQETAEPTQKAEAPIVQKSTLVDKCSPYFVDDEGKDAHINREPLYKLQSVADILKSDSEETIKRLSQKYGLVFEDEGKKTTPKFEPEVFEDVIPEKPENEPKKPSFVISDIDMSTTEIKLPEQPMEAVNATVTFTPVRQGETASPQITVTTKTQSIDLTGELMKLPETVTDSGSDELTLQKNEFDEFVPKEEFTDTKQAGKLIRKLSIAKKNAFLQAFFSFILTAVLGFLRLPFMSELLLEHTVPTMIIATCILAVGTLLNLDMFISFKHLFSRRATADGCAALASIFTLAYAVAGIMNGDIILDVLILASIIIFFRALSKFWKNSTLLSNLKLIAATSPKNAIKLIGDSAVTFAMAKDAVEGDALIAAPQKATHIANFMKYSTYSSFLGGKMNIVNIFSLVLSLILGIACAVYFDGAVYGFYAAAAIQCFAAVPCIFFIDALPLYSATKRLNKMGAMLAGKVGAEQIEMANAAVLSSTDLFPKGTVTLHNMQVLAENSLDDTLIRAASLTEYIGSTLAPIFKEIAKSGNVTTLPDTDTVKYEDRMGISGWVDNRLLFIGNRTLMEAHGIDVPSVEVDRRILRSGYFPVYVATGDKACALLAIQYSVNPKVARELRILTGLGVTLLVNNSDPNLTEEMICDYLGLYRDSVKVMSAAGCHMYKSTVVSAKEVSAPAAFKTNPLALASIINCAAKFKRSNILLTVLYIISVVLGALIFAYASLGGSGDLIQKSTLLLYGLICTAVSYLIYLTEKP